MPKQEKTNDDPRLFAFLATFLSIVGFLIALIVKKNDKYVMHYAKQSAIIFIVFIIGMAVDWIPIIGDIISIVVNILGLLFWVISWVYALSGEFKDVPFVGEYSQNLKI
jgi:uncharacterized membrane protein